MSSKSMFFLGKQSKWLVASCLGWALASSAFGAAKGDAAKGKALYVPCAQCHGANGEGKPESTPVALRGPKLSGQHAWYLVESIGKYKNGHRGADAKDTSGAIMKGMAVLLANDQAIADVVAYIGTLK
ncbi:MAG: c-type cytochrome [Oligoflexales bacterium]|nr:c-type cytochrome [Oligoflexales bacterium]